jgi:RimJ/RimL family protein N-acetyltransferase
MKNKIRVYLRALEIEDHIFIHKWRQDDEISRNFGGIKMFASSLNEKKWVEDRIFDKQNVSCAICLKETDEFIGCIFLSDIDMHNRSGHCPTFIGEKSYWGKGYATEARMLMLHYAFHERGLNRIWARIIEDNIGSTKMLEKCGYQKEGLMRQSSFKDGELKNEYLYAVLKEDFEKIWIEKNRDEL